MAHGKKIFALAVGAVMAVSLLAGCGSGNKPDDLPAADGAGITRICYDNLGGGYVREAETKTVVKGVKSYDEYDKDNFSVSKNTVATYDTATGTFTAKSEGTVVYKTEKGEYGRIEVVPAYITDPGNQYTGTSSKDTDLNNGAAYLGNTHDPSFIETVEHGFSTYYLFSTGWGAGNDIHASYDGGITWEYLGKTFYSGDYNDATVLPQELKSWMGATNNTGDIQWWAPDIVPAAGGGYWLYTCTVMNDNVMANAKYTSPDTSITPTTTYSRAAIVLFWTESLDMNWSTSASKRTGKFEYKGVLMQSAIPQDASGGIDVNSIDPQIIYSPEGKMYMAYGSFGTGNWMLELDPETGLRKDGVYSDGEFKDLLTIRKERNKVVSGSENVRTGDKYYKDFLAGEEVTSDFYGRMISLGAMEAPIINRHDNVTVTDENAQYDANGNPVNAQGKTFYYTMHSYNGLADNYQMWGGRSESVWGIYKSTTEGLVVNVNVGQNENQGNKYMGGFKWRADSKVSGCNEFGIVCPGHNDLYTAESGTNLAAYITRTYDYGMEKFVVQVHQYYLNSLGDICINPNRYAGEIDRYVSEDELFAYTDNGRFEMVVLTNEADWQKPSATIYNESMEVTLDKDTHEIKKGGSKIGTWQMYGKGYIKFTFDETLKGSRDYDSGETVYYGVVRSAWLGNRNQSGFTISCMGHTAGNTQSMAMFMNNYSNIEL